MTSDYKRVNVLISAEQYQEICKKGLNFSGLVRDLLSDRFSGSNITISLSSKVRTLYDQVVSNFGASDKDLEPFLVEALDRFLIQKSKQIEQVRSQLKKK